MGTEIRQDGSPDINFSLCVDNVGTNPGNHQEVSLYPNPTRDILVIQTLSGGPSQITITTISGKLALTCEMEGNTHQVDLSELGKGIYFVSVKSLDLYTTKKIIKY